MRYDRKFTKHERKQLQVDKMKKSLEGNGMFLFENNTNADLTLPRPTKSGRRVIGPKEQFQGDDYYMSMVRNNFLRLIEVLQTPQQEQEALLKQEEAVNQPEKLILDQPDVITEQGKIEHVAVGNQPQPLNETPAQPQAQPEVLINESPVDGGFVIVED
jgi:hypothetical protein